jgi:hypothetical protein
MFNRLSIIAITFVIAFATTFVYDAQAQKPIQGQVVSLNDIVMGGKGKVTKEQALKLVETGNPVVFKSGKKIYFVFNEDGSFAGKKLANFANSEKVGIMGKAKKVNGVDIIIMSMIDAM